MTSSSVKRHTVSFSVESKEQRDEVKNGLNHLSDILGFSQNGFQNASAVVRAIALGKISLEHCPGPQDVEALFEALRVLRAASDWQRGFQIINYLNRLSLEPAQREYLNQIASSSLRQTEATLQECIEARQPFQISYEKPNGSVGTYAVRWGQLVYRDRYTYLDCWTDDRHEDSVIRSLSNNRSLRLDRIDNSLITVQPRKLWRTQGLDTINIEFRVFGSLAINYERKPEDLLVEPVVGSGSLRVKRSISSVFWFTREILRYGSSAQVVSPQPLVEHVKGQVAEIAALYE